MRRYTYVDEVGGPSGPSPCPGRASTAPGMSPKHHWSPGAGQGSQNHRRLLPRAHAGFRGCQCAWAFRAGYSPAGLPGDPHERGGVLGVRL